MKKIAIVFWSGTGNTEAMAHLIADSARAAGAQVDLFAPADFSPAKLDAYDVIGLGCPAMGSEQLEETEFQPLYDDLRGSLSGRSVALFGSYSWAEGEWMRTWAEDCADAGAQLVGEPLAVYAAPEGDSEEACKALGAAMANA